MLAIDWNDVKMITTSLLVILVQNNNKGNGGKGGEGKGKENLAMHHHKRVTNLTNTTAFPKLYHTTMSIRACNLRPFPHARCWVEREILMNVAKKVRE